MKQGRESGKYACGAAPRSQEYQRFGRRLRELILGSERHFVCAPALDGEGREGIAFGATTPELYAMCKWLKVRKVESVAM